MPAVPAVRAVTKHSKIYIWFLAHKYTYILFHKQNSLENIYLMKLPPSLAHIFFHLYETHISCEIMCKLYTSLQKTHKRKTKKIVENRKYSNPVWSVRRTWGWPQSIWFFFLLFFSLIWTRTWPLMAASWTDPLLLSLHPEAPNLCVHNRIPYTSILFFCSKYWSIIYTAYKGLTLAAHSIQKAKNHITNPSRLHSL